MKKVDTVRLTQLNKEFDNKKFSSWLLTQKDFKVNEPQVLDEFARQWVNDVVTKSIINTYL